MRRTRKVAKIIESSDSEDNIPLKKLHHSPNTNPCSTKDNKDNDSSSESDIENYLQPIDKIDLNSSFFSTRKKNEEEFNQIEKELFAGITRLSDSESDDADTNVDTNLPRNFTPNLKHTETESEPSTSGTKLNFKQLEEYAKQIEEAKKHVEKYNAKKKASKKIEENNLDISNLLAVGESKRITLENIKPEDLHSSDFESCDSEQENWEEVKLKDSQETKEHVIPKKDIQIVVNMPDSCRKKKGIDLLAAMKRRLNRIRKENQVYVHKVHLLCWIAHGNYVNAAINNTEVLGLALSLLPSDKCYPSDRTDLSYLEQIVQWYKKAINLVEKPIPKKSDLVNSLKLQISKKGARNKNMFVYIFIAILRALGIQCRLVLSFQVEPLRPPASELHSLAKDDTTKETKGKDLKTKSENDKSPSVKEPTKSKAIHQKKDKNSSLIKSNGKPSTNSDVTGHKTEKSKIDNKELLKRESRSENKLSNNNAVKKVQKKINENKSTTKKDDTLNVKETKKERSKSESNKEKKTLESQKSSKTKEKFKDGDIKIKENYSKNALDVKETKVRSKSEGNRVAKTSDSKTKSNLKKEVIKTKFPKKEKTKAVPQVDGSNHLSDEEYFITQLDGADDKKKKSPKKPNLKKLNTPANVCNVKTHSTRLKTVDNGHNSEDDFRPRSPFAKKNTESPKVLEKRKVNLHKLKNAARKKEDMPKAIVPGKKQLDVKNDIISLIKGRMVEQKHVDRSRKVNKRKPLPNDSDSDSDFMPEPVKKKHHDSDSDIDYFVPKPKVKQRIRILKKGSDVKSSTDSDPEKTGKKKGNNLWAEVFLEAEEKWISVDVVRGQVHCVNELFTRATHPVSYIVAWSNNNNVKDITKRYCTNFNTITRKLRIDSKWWDATLKPFLGKYTARDREEDDDLNRQQLDQPLPKSITEYKNHPLYALRRHLLKFEEMYPPDVQPLGFIRGEAVYPRNCVYVCHSRDIWLKEAKVVKLGEQPYKIVKARPKYDKLSNKVITDQLLEIFGEWQTGDYEPPTAENGVVPRNAFGNVELFKQCMLPKGTVHLKLPGLNKVCRKMNIDCASAIVGFDFHGGWSHPMYDGFVVCEEFTDAVVAAWESEQEEIEKKENEKIEKRVYGNWKKLIKGLLIRERLKAKYDFGGASTSKESNEKKPKGPRFCTKKK